MIISNITKINNITETGEDETDNQEMLTWFIIVGFCLLIAWCILCNRDSKKIHQDAIERQERAQGRLAVRYQV